MGCPRRVPEVQGGLRGSLAAAGPSMGAPWGWSIPTWAPLSWEDNGHWDHRGHLPRCHVPPATPLLQGAPPYPRNSSYMEQAALLPPLPIHSQPAFLNEDQTPQSLPMHPNPWGWLSSFPSAVVPRWHPCVGDVPHPWLRFFCPPPPPISQCPTFKREADATEVPEPFAAEAKFFTESRLLQRDVQIVLESCHNQNILGTILHPASGAGGQGLGATGWDGEPGAVGL